MTATCITNDVVDLRSCVELGQHRSNCDGHARRYDRKLDRTVILDDECRGCLPRRAEVGRLCYDHLMKLEQAFSDVHELVVHLWTEPSNGVRDTNDRVSGGGGPSWPIPESRVRASWIVASMRNAVEVLLTEVDDQPTIDQRRIDAGRGLSPSTTDSDVDLVVSQLRAAMEVDRDVLIGRARGAEAAVRFVQVLQSALWKFPLVERKHRVNGLRCPGCSQVRMMWTPPLMHRGDVVIECANCHTTRPQKWLERYAEVVTLDPVEI